MLLTPEDEQRCLDCCRRHLDAGGRLVIDIFDPLLDLLVPDPPPQGRPGPARWGVHPVTKNELQVEVLSRTNDPVSQTLEEAWRFTELAGDGSVVRTEDEVLRMRWMFRWEMRYLLERQGFVVEHEYSDFHRSPPAYGKEQVWVARTAGGG